eukprot:g704.t1
MSSSVPHYMTPLAHQANGPPGSSGRFAGHFEKNSYAAQNALSNDDNLFVGGLRRSSVRSDPRAGGRFNTTHKDSSFSKRVSDLSNNLEAESSRRESLETMLEKSQVLSLLSGPPTGAIVSTDTQRKPRKAKPLPVTRQYRHKSDMKNDVTRAAREYEICRQKCEESEKELEAVQQEAKLAVENANIAKIKVKSLLILMRKMVALSVSGREGTNNSVVLDSMKGMDGGMDGGSGDAVESLIEEKLNNISKILPEYNKALDSMSAFAQQAADNPTSQNSQEKMKPTTGGGESSEGNESYDDILNRLMQLDRLSS